MKAGTATKVSILHGLQNSRLHKKHQVEQKAKILARKRFVTYTQDEMQEGVGGDAHPPFKSDVSKLKGKSFAMKNNALEEVPDDIWLMRMQKAEKEFSWYHNKENRCRKIKGSDLARKTIDLRPDHSRVVQYLISAGKTSEVEKALARIRAKKMELFEKIYHRKVLFAGEHTDSGQHHDDLWHTGIEVSKTASITPKRATWYGKELMPKGIPIPLRTRTESREFGVGVGASSWARHLSAFRESGMKNEKIQDLCGATIEAIETDIGRATKQNGEPPRDLLLQKELDIFASQELKPIHPSLYEKALGEYVADRKQGYEAGLLGVKKGNEERLLIKVYALKKELEEKKDIARYAQSLVQFLSDKTKARLLSAGGLAGQALEKLSSIFGLPLPRFERAFDLGKLPAEIKMSRKKNDDPGMR